MARQIVLRNHPNKRSTLRTTNLKLFSDFNQITLQDISDIIIQVTDIEVQKEIDKDNKPSSLFINSRPAGSVKIRRPGGTGQYVFKTRTVFGQTQDIQRAAEEAFRLLLTLTRIRSGAAKGSYNVYLGNTANSQSPGSYVGMGASAIRSLGKNLTDNSMVTITGPNVIYGRRLYWNPKGGKTIKKSLATSSKAKILGSDGKAFKFRGTLPIHTDVKRRMSRSIKYKSLSFGDPFFAIGPTNIVGDGRVPSITISVKSAGRLN